MAQSPLTVKILSPTQMVYDGFAEAVFLPGELCPFEVLKGHAPIVSSLGKGAVRIREANGGEKSFAVDGGFVRVKDNVITVCVE